MNGQQFIDALHQLEDNNESGPIVGLCAEDAEITNPHVNKQHARPQGAQRFWQQYRSTFDTVHSNFLNVIEADSSTVLEWESEGTLKPGNQPVNYRGVSIIQWNASDQITRFAAYFDTDDLHVDHT
jgi:hypothetical protein